MRRVQRAIVSFFCTNASLLMLSACAPNPLKTTAPVVYNQICEPQIQHPQRGKATDASGKAAAAAGSEERADARTPADPALFADDTKAKDIAQARVRIQHVREAYEAFECHEEISNRNRYDRPLIVTAIAATAAALAKANSYVIGGIGVTAGAIATFKSYNHPDTDRDAFLTAYARLTCLYDETHSLVLNVRMDTMTYDRDAVQIQVGIVTDDIAPLTGDQSTLTPQEKAVLSAANAAIAAGNKTIDATNGEINAYDDLSTIIYKQVDSIDISARQANKSVSGTLASYMTSMKDAYTAVGQSKAKADDAKKTTDAADAAQNAAGLVPATPKADKNAPASGADKQKAAAVKKLTTGQAPPLVAAAVAGVAAPAAPAAVPTTLPPAVASLRFHSSCADSASPYVCKKPAPNAQATPPPGDPDAQLPAKQILSDTASGDISKLVRLAQLANNSLPSPTYTTISAKVTGCVPNAGGQ